MDLFSVERLVMAQEEVRMYAFVRFRTVESEEWSPTLALRVRDGKLTQLFLGPGHRLPGPVQTEMEARIASEQRPRIEREEWAEVSIGDFVYSFSTIRVQAESHFVPG